MADSGAQRTGRCGNDGADVTCANTELGQMACGSKQKCSTKNRFK